MLKFPPKKPVNSYDFQQLLMFFGFSTENKLLKGVKFPFYFQFSSRWFGEELRVYKKSDLVFLKNIMINHNKKKHAIEMLLSYGRRKKLLFAFIFCGEDFWLLK